MPITPYDRIFRQAASYIERFISKLGTIKVQLHDGLELVVGGINVLAAADNQR